MKWSLIKVTDLPFGERELYYGCLGRDVKELQDHLSQRGFYFGKSDGLFGILTKEAVIMLQKTFNLRADGIAGREVHKLFKTIPQKTGRIIYIIKKQENLNMIAKKFTVKRTAFKPLPGQGNPQRKIYPGMRILLHQKALFCWDDPDKSRDWDNITGWVVSDYFIDSDGKLSRSNEVNEAGNVNIYHLISATAGDWVQILSVTKQWRRLSQELRKIKTAKIGFDLRLAPVEKINQWIKFLEYNRRSLEVRKLKFIVLPFITPTRNLENQLFWLNFPTLYALADLVILEPVFNMESPLAFETSAVQFFKFLPRLKELNLAGKTLLVEKVGGWDWNLAQDQYKEISFKEAKLIRAQNFRETNCSPSSKYTTLYYQRRNERHSIIYRDEEGWRELLEIIIKKNLLGLVLRNAKNFGKSGPGIIASSFAILPEQHLIINNK